MSIKGDVNELKQLNEEIKRLKSQLKELRKYAKNAEERIITYLNEKQQFGVKHQNTAIVVETKSKRLLKKNKEKNEDAIKILRNHGIDNAKEVLEEVLNARRGEETEISAVKIRNIKNPEA
jgi:predicted patatin/cPLA2 family phospholipase